MGDSSGGPQRLRGLTVDAQGHAWAAGNDPCGLVRFDTLGKVLVDGDIALPGCEEPVGVSIDVDGMVWVVDRGADVAFKVDPDGYDVQTVTGLVAPYTYSDMTGAGLGLVVHPPPG
jgi:streptogramin lyase